MKTADVRTNLSEETLEMVSGGMDAGRIGPKDDRVIKAKSFIKETQNLLAQAKDVFAPELDDNLKRAFNALDKKAGFNISEAVILLKRSGHLVELFVKREPLRHVIHNNLGEAKRILEPLV